MNRILFTLICLSLLISACGASSNGAADSPDSADSEDSPGLCDMLTNPALLALDESIEVTLADAQRASVETVGETCEVRYEAGNDWVELSFNPEDLIDTSDFLPLGDEITTNGLTMSTAATNQGLIVVVATTSNPAAISTWDASLSGVSVLLAN